MTERDHDPDVGFRAFSDFNQPSRAEDNWGMVDTVMPDWLQGVHNAYKGERCFLFGTGPSLVAQLPLLEALKAECTFTCNRMKRWKGLPFKPWLHCVTEPGPFIRWGKGVHPEYDYPGAQNRVACIWFPVTAEGWLWLPKASDDIQLRWHGTQGLGERLAPVPTAWASPLTIAQLALWMGFERLYILGCDTTQTGQAWDPVYGRTQQPRNIRSIVECAERLCRDVKRAGREMWDCTPGGRLNQEGAIPYRALEEVL